MLCVPKIPSRGFCFPDFLPNRLTKLLSLPPELRLCGFGHARCVPRGIEGDFGLDVLYLGNRHERFFDLRFDDAEEGTAHRREGHGDVRLA